MKIRLSRSLAVAAALSLTLVACGQNGSGSSPVVPSERAPQFRGFVPNPGPTSPPGSGDCAHVALPANFFLGTVRRANLVNSQPTISFNWAAVSCGSTDALYHPVYTIVPDRPFGSAGAPCETTSITGPQFPLAPRANRGINLQVPTAQCEISENWTITVQLFTDDPASQQFVNTSVPGSLTGVTTQIPMSTETGAFYTMDVTPFVPNPGPPIIPVLPVIP
jgi:hypothetical protein